MNCYNGCVETIADECVKYTGLSIPELGISTGDTLKHVEQAITNALTPLLTGTGDAITLASGDVCDLIVGYLTSGLVHTSKDWIKALAKGECDLQGQISGIDAVLAALNADYSIGCLTGVTASSDTHAIVQAIITKLCATAAGLTALGLDVSTNYVKLADLNTLIQAYLDSIHTTTQYNSRMVPYTAVEYYGTLANFDNTGAGISANGYDKIYLCNGLNGTPDKRGRVGVGAIVSVPGGALDSAVNPSYPGNPNYAVRGTAGANTVVLTSDQLPPHTHANTLTDPTHSHLLYSNDSGTDTVIDATHYAAREHAWGDTLSYKVANGTSSAATLGKSEPKATGVTINNVAVGNGVAHANIQPVVACYYVMYIP
jgi:microcystin-dependent protein